MRWALAAVPLLLLPLAAAERPAAPDFHLPSLDGPRLRLSSLRGSLVVVNFWATWCKPCRDEIPLLAKLHGEFLPRGVRIIGVAMDERGWPAVTPFAEANAIPYPVLLGNPRTARAYGGLATLPHTLFLDRHGRIAATLNTALTEDTFRRLAGLLLQEEGEQAAKARPPLH